MVLDRIAIDEQEVSAVAGVSEGAGPGAGGAFPADLGAIVASSVLERSLALRRPFRVNFDVDCSFCRKNRQVYRVNEEYEHPEPTFIKRMAVSVAALSYDQTFPGRTVVVLRDHETDLNYVLKTKLLLYLALMEDVSAVVDALEAALAPDRMNYAVFMNQNEHLHVHLIPRYRAEGEAYRQPPPFRGIDALDPAFDYRSLALRIRKRIRHKKSPLSRYCEQLIDNGLPP